MERREAQQAREDYRFGLLASLVANAFLDREKRPQGYSPEDFFPSLKRRGKRRRQTRQDALEMQKRLREQLQAAGVAIIEKP